VNNFHYFSSSNKPWLNTTNYEFLLEQEEMEEKTENIVYEDFKFLTKDEMDRYDLSKYIDQGLVRAHMHGYVMKLQLYKKVNCFRGHLSEFMLL
jgi:hypothetical protein